MIKKICNECKGTGMYYRSGSRIGHSCLNCSGKGFCECEVTTPISSEEVFQQKKRIDGIDTVYLDTNFFLRDEYSLRDSLGTISYEDFVKNNLTSQTITIIPNMKKYICPVIFIEQYFPQKGKESSCLLCSGNMKDCPFLPWQRTKKLLDYCWKSYEETLMTSNTIELSPSELKFLIHILSNLFSSEYARDIDTLHAYLSLYKKVSPSSLNPIDIIKRELDLPRIDPKILERREEENRRLNEWILAFRAVGHDWINDYNYDDDILRKP